MQRNAVFPLVLIGLGVAAGPCGQAHAQNSTGNVSGVSKFPASYFVDSAPANAWDMVSRLPGFTVADADKGIRGYAEARGNVLVDGSRPTSKSESTEDLLKRIPAESVQFIQVIRGGVDDIDMAGHATVVNVVRKTGASQHYAVKAGVLAGTNGWKAPTGQLQYGYRNRGRVFEVAVALAPKLDDHSGRGTIRTLGPDGTLRQVGDLSALNVERNAKAIANWKSPFAAGTLSVNGALSREKERIGTDIKMHDRLDVITSREREDTRVLEAGARYVRTLGNQTSLVIMASQRLGDEKHEEQSHEGRHDEEFWKKTRTGESIGRITLSHDWSEVLSIQSSLEGAFNFLDSNARLQQEGAAVALPGSDVRIEERRVEAAVKTVWKINPKWTLEGGLRVEKSTLSQTGDTPVTRHFVYPKPRLALHWRVNEENQWRLALSREVGQLDFENFAASASLDTGMVTAGNAELEPERTDRLELGWTHDLQNGGAYTISWTHDRIDNAVDRVLVVGDNGIFDAPGNIGSGRRDIFALDLMLPLDGLGFTGGRFHPSLQWHSSRVTDPATGQDRRISKELPLAGSVMLTQDLPAWKLHWGIEVKHIAQRRTKYRFNEVQRESEGTGWTVFAERQFADHWRLRVEATDMFGRGFIDIRSKFGGVRGTHSLQEVERRDRDAPGFVIVTLRYDM